MTQINSYWVQAYLDGHLTAASQANPTAFAREWNAETLEVCRSAADALRESSALKREFWERPTETARRLTTQFSQVSQQLITFPAITRGSAIPGN
jgi:hypothetical protein